MAIYKKKGGRIWYAEVYVRAGAGGAGFGGSGAGRTVRFSTRTEDEAEAREVERIFRAAHNRTLPIDRLHAMLDALYGDAARPKPVGVSLANASRRYEAVLAAGGDAPSRGVLSAKRNSVRRFLRWRDANWPACATVGEVTRSVAGAFAASLGAERSLADKTKRECLSDLGRVWNVLMRIDETIRENPWRLFHRAVRVQKDGAAFTPDEVTRIFAACGEGEWRTACAVALWTGLRFGDVCRLRWEDVDWDERVVRVVPSKTRRHAIAVTIPMSSGLEAELSRVRREHGAVCPLLAASYPHPERSEAGAFSAVLKRAGVVGRRFHDFRHTFASRLADAGVGTEVIKRLGGWNVTATALRYQHSERLGELREAIRAVEGKER